MIEVGEYAKVIGENRVFKVIGYSDASRIIPDRWYVDEDGCSVNPEMCEKYSGATSVLKNEAAGLVSTISEMIHYPECWDLAAYPSLLSAVQELDIGCDPKQCCKKDKIIKAAEKAND